MAVYRVKDLHNPAKKWKLERNATQLFMSGTVVLYQDVNIVVVEGGPKQLKKYRQLMLKRVKWGEDTYTDKDGTEHSNKCELVWEVCRHNGMCDIEYCQALAPNPLVLKLKPRGLGLGLTLKFHGWTAGEGHGVTHHVQ